MIIIFLPLFGKIYLRISYVNYSANTKFSMSHFAFNTNIYKTWNIQKFATRGILIKGASMTPTFTFSIVYFVVLKLFKFLIMKIFRGIQSGKSHIVNPIYPFPASTINNTQSILFYQYPISPAWIILKQIPHNFTYMCFIMYQLKRMKSCICSSMD